MSNTVKIIQLFNYVQMYDHEFSPTMAVCSSAAPDFPRLSKTLNDKQVRNGITCLKRLYIAGKTMIRLLSSSHKLQRTDEKPSAPYPRPMRKAR